MSDNTSTRQISAHKSKFSPFSDHSSQLIISNDIWNPLLHATSVNAGKASPAAPVSLGMINSPEKRSVLWPEKLDNTPETAFYMRIRKDRSSFGERLLYLRNGTPRSREEACGGGSGQDDGEPLWN